MSILKDPWVSWRAGETDYRGIDWKNDLDTGETITTQGYTSDTAANGLTVVSVAVQDTKTIVRLSGGTSGVEAEVVGWITTSTGRHLTAVAPMTIL